MSSVRFGSFSASPRYWSLSALLTAGLLLLVSTPVMANGSPVTNPPELALGGEHSCKLSAGVVYCWGRRNFGQLGTGVISDFPEVRPERVVAANGFTNTEVTAVTAGGDHTCAVEKGSVYCWGRASNGVLGNTSLSNNLSYAEPQKVSKNPDGSDVGFLNSTVIAISAGHFHTCAIETIVTSGVNSDELFCWGSNASLQMGSASTGALPRRPHASNERAYGSVSAVSTGYATTCVISKNDGKVYCWGRGREGQFGDGVSSVSDNRGPILVSDNDGFVNSNIASISVSGAHICAIDVGDKLFCWGANHYGQLGIGTTTTPANNGERKPRRVGLVDDERFQKVVVGGSDPSSNSNDQTRAHTCALRKKVGTAELEPVCWGRNDRAQLSANSSSSNATSNSNTPRLITYFNDEPPAGAVSFIATGYQHSCASYDNGVTFCWGENNRGQSGNGTVPGSSASPDRVFWATQILDPPSPPGAPTINTVTANNRSIAVSWTAPSDNGGSTITGYTATAYTTPDNVVAGTCTSTSTSCSITGLENNTAYVVRVVATNGAGTSVASADSDSVTPVPSQAAIDRILDYAADSGNTAPTISDYLAADMQGAVSGNLAAYNSALASLTGITTMPQVQEVVDAYNKILAAAGFAPALDLDIADYAALGIVVSPEALPLLNRSVATANPSPARNAVDTVTKLQAMAEAAQVLAEYVDDKTKDAPTAADFATLRFAPMTDQTAPLFADYLTRGILEGAANWSGLTPQVNATRSIRRETSSSPASANNYASLGLTISNNALNLGALLFINDVLLPPDGLERSDTIAKVQGVIDIATEILTAAQGNTEPDLNASDYTAFGVSVLDDAVPLLNEIIGRKARTDVDRLNKLQGLADALNRIIGRAADDTAPAPTLADFTLLGFTDVTADNLAAVITQIEGSTITSLADIEALIASTLNNPALDLLRAYDGSSEPAPGKADYDAAGVNGVVEGRVPSYNSFLAELDAPSLSDIQAMVDAYNSLIAAVGDETLSGALTIDQFKALGLDLADDGVLAFLRAIIAEAEASDIDSFAKLQDLVDKANRLWLFATGDEEAVAPTISDYEAIGTDGLVPANIDAYNSAVEEVEAVTPEAIQSIVTIYNTVLDAADGSAQTVADLSETDYAKLGVIVNPLAFDLFNDAVANQNRGAVDSVEALQAIADAAERVIDLAGGDSASQPTLDDFVALGILGIDANNLSEVRSLIADADANELDSVAALTEVIESVLRDLGAIDALLNFGSDANAEAPELETYDAAGVNGVVEGRVPSYNSFLAELDAPSLSDIQAMVDAYNSLIAAVGDETLSGALTIDQFKALGLDLADDGVLAFLRAIIAEAEASDIDSFAKLQGLVDRANRLWNHAKGEGGAVVPSIADYEVIGIDDLVPANIDAYNSAVEEVEAVTPEAIQSIVTVYNSVLDAADGNGQTVPDLAQTDYAKLGVIVNPLALDLFNDAVANQSRGSVDSVEALQAIADAASRVSASANGIAGGATTPEDFIALGILGVTSSNIDRVIEIIADAGPGVAASVSGLLAVLAEILQPPLPVPTLSAWGLLWLLALIMLVGLRQRRELSQH